MKELDLVFYDVCQAFDSLWPEKTYLDLFNNGVNDDMLNLLYEGSKEAEVRVKTPIGETNMKEINNNIILQGETPSSILCNSSMDMMTKECNIEPGKYKEKVEIPKLSFVDDLVDIHECGLKTKEMNKYTSDAIDRRRHHLAVDKCH